MSSKINFESELEKILESPFRTSCLERLDNAHDVVLYGAGKMGEMALDLLKYAGIKPKYFVDKTPGHRIDGLDVMRLDSIAETDKETKLFLVCVVTTPYDQIKDFLNKNGFKKVMHFYEYSEDFFHDVMPNGWFVNEIDGPKIESIKAVLSNLSHDDQSVIDYLRMLWWRLKRVDYVYPEYPVLQKEKYFQALSFPCLTEQEVFVDGGAHLGTTIQLFLDSVLGHYKSIYAFEPDQGNFCSLKNSFFDGRIFLSDYALGDNLRTVNFRDGLGYASRTTPYGQVSIHTISLDSLTDITPTVIKLHLEGDELLALKGAKDSICKNRPILMVLADHDAEGLFEIPLLLTSFENYKLFFNLHDYCGNTSIFYAYPTERLFS